MRGVRHPGVPRRLRDAYWPETSFVLISTYRLTSYRTELLARGRRGLWVPRTPDCLWEHQLEQMLEKEQLPSPCRKQILLSSRSNHVRTNNYCSYESFCNVTTRIVRCSCSLGAQEINTHVKNWTRTVSLSGTCPPWRSTLCWWLN